MVKATPDEAGGVLEELRDFRAHFQSVVIATSDAGGEPEASYAPFVDDGDTDFYVYVSALARHTRNLRAIERASLLFLEDEHAAANVFARRRLTYHCIATPIAREDPEWALRMEAFAQRFGSIMSVLSGLADFQLFRLSAQSGRYVRGFGSAYHLTGTGLSSVRPASGADSPASR